MLPLFASSLLRTRDEIEEAGRLPSIWPADLRQNALVRGQFVVKHTSFDTYTGLTLEYGTRVKENKGHALLALERVPSIPQVLYIIVEFRKGRQLSELWPDLSEGQKSHIVAQLRRGMSRLRDIPSPGAIFASVEHGPLLHGFFWSPEPDPEGQTGRSRVRRTSAGPWHCGRRVEGTATAPEPGCRHGSRGISPRR